MPPKENFEMSCEECIHFFACSMQCGGDIRTDNANHCECYEPIKSSMAYYVGTLDGAKGKITNRLRELAEADKDGRLVVLPCKVGDTVYRLQYIEPTPGRFTVGVAPIKFALVWLEEFGKTVFLTREEAEKALAEMEGKKDG